MWNLIKILMTLLALFFLISGYYVITYMCVIFLALTLTPEKSNQMAMNVLYSLFGASTGIFSARFTMCLVTGGRMEWSNTLMIGIPLAIFTILVILVSRHEKGGIQGFGLPFLAASWTILLLILQVQYGYVFWPPTKYH